MKLLDFLPRFGPRPSALAHATPASAVRHRRRILITNRQLTEGTGTEQVARDLALELGRRGHTVAVFTPHVGRFAARMRADGIRVVTVPGRIGWSPEVIHGHHHVETMTALTAFPRARAIFVCHDARSWADHPPVHARVMRYVAVDDNCRERLAPLVPPERLRWIGNWFDADRFRPRPPLPARPRRALLYSNYAVADSTPVRALREACASAGVVLDLLGHGSGTGRHDPERVLGGYDLVFAKGKCAIEALATGCAVIVCHERLGPLVTTGTVETCRRWNFGLRLARRPIEADSVRREIAAYDATDAARVADFVRAECGMAEAISAYERLYEEILPEWWLTRRDNAATNLEALLKALAGRTDHRHDSNAHARGPASAGTRGHEVPI